MRSRWKTCTVWVCAGISSWSNRKSRSSAGMADVDRDRDQVAAAAALQRALVEQHEVLGLLVDLDVAVADQAEARRARSPRSPGTGAAGRCRPGPRATGSGSPSPGRRTKRSTCGGSGSSAISGRRSSLRCSFRMAEKPPLGMNGKRMRRIDGERRQDREDLVDEILVEPGALAVGRARPGRGRRCRPRAAPPAGRPRRPAGAPSGRGALADARRAARPGVRPSSLSSVDAGLQHVDQAGHADHVELVEVVGRDRQEAHAARAADGAGCWPPRAPAC